MAKAKMDAEDRLDGGADEATEGKKKPVRKGKKKAAKGRAASSAAGDRFKALVASLSKRPASGGKTIGALNYKGK